MILFQHYHFNTRQDPADFGIINMEGDSFFNKRSRASAAFFMPELELEIQPESRQEAELRLSYFDINRPMDWVGHERELMLELDAPGCYITKPCPVPE